MKGSPMTEPHSRRGPLSTIGGWMIAIAAIGVAMAILVLVPPLFILVVLAAFEALAIGRFRESRRRRPMPGYLQTIWVFLLLIVIPIVSVVTAVAALAIYCTVNPKAFS
jgi:hypothetical protein